MFDYCRANLKADALIAADIPRAFPHLNKLLQEVHSLEQSLKDVLGSFQCYRPDLGYVQGMCYLAAIILIHLSRPEQCFVAFSNVIL